MLIITDADISPRTVRWICTALRTQFNLSGAEGFTCYWHDKGIPLEMLLYVHSTEQWSFMWLRGAKQQQAVWASLFLEDPGLCGNDMQRPFLKTSPTRVN